MLPFANSYNCMMFTVYLSSVIFIMIEMGKGGKELTTTSLNLSIATDPGQQRVLSMVTFKMYIL